MTAGAPAVPSGHASAPGSLTPDADALAGELLELEDDEATPPAAGGWVCQCVCDNPGLVHR